MRCQCLLFVYTEIGIRLMPDYIADLEEGYKYRITRLS